MYWAKQFRTTGTIVLFLGSVFFILSACTEHRVIETTIQLQTPPVFDNVISTEIERVTNVRRVYGFSAGISFYNPKSKFSTLPAHAVSAASIMDTIDASYFYTKESRSNYEGMRLTTDLRLKIGEPSNLAILNKLATNVGISSINEYDQLIFRGATPNRDGTWPYFGDNQPMSRKKISEGVSRAISEMREALLREGTITGMLYFSAHGIVKEDNKIYIVPGDADASDPSTWIPINDILYPVYDFAKEQPNNQLNKRIVIIFDICLKEGRGTPTVSTPPTGVAVLFSTSPGQYAWHYLASEKFSQTTSINGAQPTIEATDIHSTMSYFPISFRLSIEELGTGMLLRTGRSEENTDDRYRRNVTVGEIVETMKVKMENLVSQDQMVNSNGGQILTAVYGPLAKDMAYLTVMRVKLNDPFKEKTDGLVYLRNIR